MAHQQQYDFCASLKYRFPEFFGPERIAVGIGSQDVNSTSRGLVVPRLFHRHVGVDMVAGPGVDVVCLGHEYKGGPFDVVYSCEVFEHDPYYALTLRNMLDLLKPKGLMFFTCASEGRARHGPGAYYRNLVQKNIEDVFLPVEHFFEWEFVSESVHHDLYFWGRR